MKHARELIVGVVFLLAVTVLVSVAVATRRDDFTPKKVLTVVFDNAGGLERGAKVLLSGIEVGSIGDITLRKTKAAVVINLREDVVLYGDAKFYIEVPLALAKPYVTIDPGTADFPESFELRKDNLTGISSPNLLKEVAPILAKIRNGEGSFGKFLTDDALYNDASAAMAEAKAAIAKINTGSGALATLINDETVAKDLRDAVASIKDIGEKIDQGKGVLGALINDEASAKELKDALAAINDITEKINNGKGAIGVLVNDEQLGADLASAVKRINQITAQVESGEGLLATLLTDKKAGQQFKAIVSDVNEVTRGLREGEGTVGKLLRDDAVFNQIESLLKRLNDSIESAREQAPISAFASLIAGAVGP